MGNSYKASDPKDGDIHIIEKGSREKDCSVCSSDLQKSTDTMVMFDDYCGGKHVYVCYACLDIAVELAKKFR